MRPARRRGALTLLVGAPLLFAACGGGGEEAKSSSTAGTLDQSTASPQPGSKAAAPGVPTSQGGDNSIQTWGLEASSAERARLSAIVQAFLDARAAGDWTRACTYLAAEQRRMFERLSEGKESGNAACAEGMGALASEVPAAAFAEEADIRAVLSLRAGDGHAFLIYTRSGDGVYATALGHEGDGWKVISVGPTALN